MPNLYFNSVPSGAGNITVSKTNYINLLTEAGAILCAADGTQLIGLDIYDTVTLTQTHGDKYAFVGWFIGGSLVSSDTSYTVRVDHDINIEARYSYNWYEVTVDVIPSFMPSPYVSSFKVPIGESVLLKAREAAGYAFYSWSDDSQELVREIYPTSDLHLIATYLAKENDSSIYTYMCFIKDQLSLTAKPKIFYKVKSFTVRNDLLTTSNSVIEFYNDVDDDLIQTGDILVLYSPKGKSIYEGVISSIEKRSINCSQMQSFYKGEWVYDLNVPEDDTSTHFIEEDFKNSLLNYASGHISGSTYVDPIVSSRLTAFSITSSNVTENKFPTKADHTTADMEEFIYSLYVDYGIVLDFNVGYYGANTVHIHKIPDNVIPVKIGDNTNAIRDISPVTEAEETNRLILFAADGTYRNTYFATHGGQIFRGETSMLTRPPLVTTAIKYSDEEEDVILASVFTSYKAATEDEKAIYENLVGTTKLYNHKVTFNLLVNNSLYSTDDFTLGYPVDIYVSKNKKKPLWYHSVLTGYEITKESNSDIISIEYTCGTLRTSLTKLLTMKKV